MIAILKKGSLFSLHLPVTSALVSLRKPGQLPQIARKTTIYDGERKWTYSKLRRISFALKDAAPTALKEVKLPKLTASEFLEYNRLAEHMNSFHNHFRVSWNELYATVSGTARKDSNPARLSPSQFTGSFPISGYPHDAPQYRRNLRFPPPSYPYACFPEEPRPHQGT